MTGECLCCSIQVWTELIVSRIPDIYNSDSYISSLSPFPLSINVGEEKEKRNEKGPCFGLELFPLTEINNLYNSW